MSGVQVYRSTDASAPVLTGQVGKLTALLRACLVNGYGSATAAGWTEPFTETTNRTVFRNSSSLGTGFYVDVADNGDGAGAAKEAFMTGFETMSALATGTGQFPTSAQLNLGTTPAGSVVVRKSNTADSTARAWTIVADETVFYCFIETGDWTNPTLASPTMFGDIFSYKASDAYRCAIVGRNVANIATGQCDHLGGLLNAGAGLTATIAGHFMARSFTAAGGSILVGKHIDFAKLGNTVGAEGNGTSGATTIGGGGSGVMIGRNSSPTIFPYPNGPDGGLWVSPIWIHHNNCVRGYFKGLWAPLHDRPLNHNDTYTGTGNMSGKTLLAQKIVSALTGNSDEAQIHIETSNTWS